MSLRNAPTTLAELVAPLSVEEFMTLLRERKLTLLRGAGGDRYGAMLNWNSLIEMIQRGQHSRNLAEFHLVKDSKLAPPDRWLKANAGGGNSVDLPKFLQFMAGGFSLVSYRIDDYAPHLTALRENIRVTVREQIRMGVIVTKGKEGAFTLHYDPEDLIILQVEGRKRWMIFGPPVINPIPGVTQSAVPAEDTLIFDEVLEPGDFLFLPAGNWHRCENQSSRSLHLGIFFQPPNALDILQSLTSQFLADDQFRMPLTRLGDASSLSDVEAGIKSRIIDRVSKLNLRDLLDSEPQS